MRRRRQEGVPARSGVSGILPNSRAAVAGILPSTSGTPSCLRRRHVSPSRAVETSACPQKARKLAAHRICVRPVLGRVDCTRSPVGPARFRGLARLRIRYPGPDGPQAVVREGFFCGLENMDVFEKTPWMDSRRPQKKTSRTAAYRQERARRQAPRTASK